MVAEAIVSDVRGMSSIKSKVEQMEGLPGDVARFLIKAADYMWITIPVALVATYLLCVYFILKYFYPIWSLGEKIFWSGIMFHYTYYQLFYSFFKCHFTKPVEVDLHYERNPIYDSEEYCEFCHKPKLPRMHHCGFCGKCIVKYDHHCSWMSACIGYHNQRYFFMFMLACFRGMIICDAHLWYIWKTYSGTPDFPFWKTLLLSLFFFNITMVMILQVTLNIIYISTNLTMIELVIHLGRMFKNKTWKLPLPYYKSLSENWREVMHIPKHLPVILGLLPYDFSSKENAHNE